MNNRTIPVLAAAIAPAVIATASTPGVQQSDKPNIIIIMTDQQRADICGREGFPLEVTPFVDKAAANGMWFDRAYTSAPASVPARTSFLTGRFPKATRVNSNHNVQDAVYTDDIFGIAKKSGYTTALIGKNHSYLTPERTDYWKIYDHIGHISDNKTPEEKAFDDYLASTAYYCDLKPSPFGTRQQQPYRMVDEALGWIAGRKGDPFFLWLSIPEPHNPYQVPQPYYSMFPPESLPATIGNVSHLVVKGERYELLCSMMQQGHVGYLENLQQLRSIYYGMIRMIDDQIARLTEAMKANGSYENTVFLIMSDHGDFAGEYGLMKKGVGLSDAVARIPMVWFGKGIPGSGLSNAHVSIVDIFPTLCEFMDAQIPQGVQGRSLRQMLSAKPYPEEEFRSVMIEDGYGGQYYTTRDGHDFNTEGAISDQPGFFDCLNTWTQSGSHRALRMGDWKLEYDMLGNGEMYNLKSDPAELVNLYDEQNFNYKRCELLAELLKWEIATEDPLPQPHRRYRFKRNDHNYMFYPSAISSGTAR